MIFTVSVQKVFKESLIVCVFAGLTTSYFYPVPFPTEALLKEKVFSPVQGVIFAQTDGFEDQK